MFIDENAFENIVCETAAILFLPQSIKEWKVKDAVTLIPLWDDLWLPNIPLSTTPIATNNDVETTMFSYKHDL